MPKKVDIMLKRIFTWTVLVCILLAGVIGYLHFNARQQQARREVIYRKAVQQAAVEKRQRVQEYEKRRRQKELQRQLLKGQVVNASAQRGPAPGR